MRQLGLSLVVGMALAACSGGPNPGVDGGPRDGGGNPVDGGPRPDGGNTMTDGGGSGQCGPTGGACDLGTATSCGTGMACLLQGSSTTSWTTICAPAGVGGDDAACDPMMAGQCQEGFGCDNDARVCRHWCCSNEDCPPTQFCNVFAGTNAGLCSAPDNCDPIAQTGCEAGQECNVLGNGDRVCDPAGTVTEGMICMARNACVAGFTCVALTTETDSHCRAYCDPSATAGNPGACPDTFMCVPNGATGFGACFPMMNP